MYNPRRDKSPVVQEGYLDLKESYLNNSVPSTLEASVNGANGIENTDEMLLPAEDNFDMMRLGVSVRDYKPESNDSVD